MRLDRAALSGTQSLWVILPNRTPLIETR